MTSTRRTILLAAGGAALALVGSGGAFVATRRPEAALRAWKDAEKTSLDLRLFAFRHAILAPNPHNRQPWQIQLVGKDEAVIYCDLDRRLPETDPFDRQITMGFGCFLELARIAAAEVGLAMETSLFPGGQTSARLTGAPIARLRFRPAASDVQDPLFPAILKRRTSRVPFDSMKAATPALVAAVLSATANSAEVRLSSDEALVKDLRALTWRAWVIEAATHRTHKESVDLMRIGRAEIEANPDGLALGGAAIEALAALGQITRPALLDPKSSASKSGSDLFESIMAQTPGYLWITTPGNSRTDQIRAGSLYARANLAASAAGLAMHPVSQALQEYPEMDIEYKALHRRLGIAEPSRVQMLARVGFAPAVAPAARWSLEAKLRT